MKLNKYIFIITLLVITLFLNGCNYTPKCEDEMIVEQVTNLGSNLYLTNLPRGVFYLPDFKNFHLEGPRTVFYDFGIDRYVCTGILKWDVYKIHNQRNIYYEITSDSKGESYVNVSLEDNFSRDSNFWLGFMRYFSTLPKFKKNDTNENNNIDIDYKKLSKKLKVPKDCLESVVSYYYAEDVAPKEMDGCSSEDLKKIYDNWKQIIKED